MSDVTAIEKDAAASSLSPMQEFYRDKVIFLTGATGVLGELFVEKLLRCNVKRLYILLRSKKQKTHEERIAETYSTALFVRLRQLDPHYLDRVGVIDGDVGRPNLGISAANIAMLSDRIEIVIHAAANVRFDCPLETIVLVNVRGTRDLLRIAKGFKCLQTFVYMSTAYCHSHKLNQSTAEQFYRTPIEPEAIIRLAERYEVNDGREGNELLMVLTDKFIHPWPNTYSFSKAITEDLIRRSLDELPIVVIRPSIVIATHCDPIEGYCTNYFGLNGVLAASGAGLARIVFGETRNVANVVCADFAINATLAVVWDKQVNSGKSTKYPPIYTLNSGHETLTWGQISDTCTTSYMSSPWLSSIWMPRTNYTMCPLVAIYAVFAYQVIPGIIFDTILWISGKKERLLPMYRRIIMFMQLIKFFMSTQWHFAADNIADVDKRMTPYDRQYFPCGVERLDFPAFSVPYAMGLRRYIAKEEQDTLPAAHRRLTILRVAHYAVLVVYYALIAAFYYYIVLKRFISLYNA